MISRITFLFIAVNAFITLNACSGYGDSEADAGFGTNSIEYGRNGSEWSSQEQNNFDDVTSGKICSVSTDYRTYLRWNSNKVYVEGRFIDGCGVKSSLQQSGNSVLMSISYMGCSSSYIDSECDKLKSSVKDLEYEVSITCMENSIEGEYPKELDLADLTFSEIAEYLVDVCKQVNEKF